MIHANPTHFDLFSGSGGFALAAKWAGFRTVAFCEIDKYCQRVLAKNFLADAMRERRQQIPGGAHGDEAPNEGWPAELDHKPTSSSESRSPRIHSDIFTLDGTQYRGIDLITGGFPCQPFSCAGKRRGKEDHRHLWPEMLRVISEARPAWVLGENVTGIIGMELDSVLSDMETIGYATRPFVIPACGVDARHRRNRVWIVAHAEGSGSRTGLCEAGTQRNGNLTSNSSNAADTGKRRLSRRCEQNQRRGEGGWTERACQWLPEPDVRGMVDGLPEELDGGFLNADQGLDSEGTSPTGTQDLLRYLWERVAVGASSQGRRSFQQLVGQLTDALCALPHETSLGDREAAMASAFGYLCRLRQSCETIRAVRDPSDSLDAIWQSLSRAEADWAHLANYLGPFHSEWPATARVSTGIKNRVDRLRGLGNSIVPQVAYQILKAVRQYL